MNKLPLVKRIQIVHLLVEGNSLRATSRITKCSVNTVVKLLIELGQACAEYHHHNVTGLNSKRVEADEIWSFIYAKDKNTSDEMKAEGKGDAWTWVAIDPDSKLIITWLVGDRSGDTAKVFIEDLATRLSKRIQLTTDGWFSYIEAVDLTFGANVDYAQLVKTFAKGAESKKGDDRRYSPTALKSFEKRTIAGYPIEDYVSTSIIERQNLTMRMSMRRFTRLTNGFSKKLENHCHAIALHYMYYNFCRKHKTIKTTPAVKAGVADHIWKIEELLELLEKKSN